MQFGMQNLVWSTFSSFRLHLQIFNPKLENMSHLQQKSGDLSETFYKNRKIGWKFVHPPKLRNMELQIKDLEDEIPLQRW